MCVCGGGGGGGERQDKQREQERERACVRERRDSPGDWQRAGVKVVDGGLASDKKEKRRGLAES